MNVVLALFIALSAGASSEEQLALPVDQDCANDVDPTQAILKDIVARLKEHGAETLIAPYEENKLEVRAPGRFQPRISWSRRGKQSILILGHVPYETQEEKDLAARRVATALYRLQLAGANTKTTATLQLEENRVSAALRPARPPKEDGKARPWVRYVSVGTVAVAVIGSGVWFENDIREAARNVGAEVNKRMPWYTEPTEQQRVEAQVRDLERFINREENRIGRADQEELARKRTQLGDLYQRYPEMRRQSGR